MTRREWIAGVPAVAVLKAGRAAEVTFERIDTHNHVHRSAPALVSAMERTGWRALSICDSRELGDQPTALPEMIPSTVRFHMESKRRWAWATTGVIWLAKRAIKKLGEFIEVLSSVEDAGKTGEELLVAVAA